MPPADEEEEEEEEEEGVGEGASSRSTSSARVVGIYKQSANRNDFFPTLTVRARALSNSR